MKKEFENLDSHYLDQEFYFILNCEYLLTMNPYLKVNRTPYLVFLWRGLKTIGPCVRYLVVLVNKICFIQFFFEYVINHYINSILKKAVI